MTTSMAVVLTHLTLVQLKHANGVVGAFLEIVKTTRRTCVAVTTDWFAKVRQCVRFVQENGKNKTSTICSKQIHVVVFFCRFSKLTSNCFLNVRFIRLFSSMEHFDCYSRVLVFSRQLSSSADSFRLFMKQFATCSTF